MTKSCQVNLSPKKNFNATFLSSLALLRTQCGANVGNLPILKSENGEKAARHDSCLEDRGNKPGK